MPQPVCRFGGERNFNRCLLEIEPGPLWVGIWVENGVLAAARKPTFTVTVFSELITLIT